MMIDPTALRILYIVLAVVGIVLLTGLALFLYRFPASLERTLLQVREPNRLLRPDQVWLHGLHLGLVLSLVVVLCAGKAGQIAVLGVLIGLLIGLAAAVWDVFLVTRLAGSLKQEFEDRGWETEEMGFGRCIGLLWTAGYLLMLLVVLGAFAVASMFHSAKGILLFALFVWIALGPVLLILWAVYWRTMSRCGQLLRSNSPLGHRPGSHEEDYDDKFDGSTPVEKPAERTLATVLSVARERGRKVPITLVARYAGKLAESLASLHLQGAAHGDVNPKNLVVDEFHLLDSARPTSGSPAEIGPEAGDRYGFGCTMYELLTGVVPSQPVANPRLLRPEVPRDLEAICLKCLSKDVANGYGSMSAIAADLDRYSKGEPVHARSLGRTERLSKWTRRRPILAASYALLLLFVMAVGIAAIRGLVQDLHDSAQQRADAERKFEADIELARVRGERIDRAVALQHKKGDPLEAEIYFLEWIKEDPFDPYPRLHLALTLERKGDLGRAITQCRDATSTYQMFGFKYQVSNAERAAAHHSLGRLLRKKGDIKGAIIAVQYAIRLDPTNPESHRELGDLLEGTGDFTGAATPFREWARLEPKNARAREALDRVLRPVGGVDEKKAPSP